MQTGCKGSQSLVEVIDVDECAFYFYSYFVSFAFAFIVSLHLYHN